MEIKNLKIPKEYERTFSLTVETFTDFDKLKVIFDSDGDIETEKDEIVLENISAGNYSFETKIYQIETFPGDAQELSYRIIGTIDSRTVELEDYNMPVKINWNGKDKNKTQEKNNFYFGIVIVIILIILICLFYYYKHKKGKKE